MKCRSTWTRSIAGSFASLAAAVTWSVGFEYVYAELDGGSWHDVNKYGDAIHRLTRKVGSLRGPAKLIDGVDWVYSLNDSGQMITFTSAVGLLQRREPNGALTSIPYTTASASRMNNAGQVAYSGTDGNLRLWTPDETVIASDYWTNGTAIPGLNDLGEIAYISSNRLKIRRTSGAVSDFGIHTSQFVGLSSLGHIIGSVQGPNYFLDTNTGLETVFDAFKPSDLNDSGIVVGSLQTLEGSRGARFTIQHGVERLRDLVDPSTIPSPNVNPTWDSEAGFAVSSSGHITCGSALLVPKSLCLKLVLEVSYGDWTSSDNPPLAVEVYRGDYLLKHWQNVVVDDSGHGLVECPYYGDIRVRVKASHWLSRSYAISAPTAGSTIPIAVELVNGDVDGDNVVSVFDYIFLSNAFDSVPGDPNWDDRADLDGDDVVSVFDYIILSDHFDETGDA